LEAVDCREGKCRGHSTRRNIFGQQKGVHYLEEMYNNIFQNKKQLFIIDDEDVGIFAHFFSSFLLAFLVVREIFLSASHTAEGQNK
jgi:hypothetical protein